jgi:hypothetical protein
MKNVVRILVYEIPYGKWLIEQEIFGVSFKVHYSFSDISYFIASSNSVISALLNEEQTLENEAASKHLDLMTTDDARVDIKSQVKTFANNFHKKSSNKNIPIDTLVQDYGTFKDTIKKRIQTNSIYRGKIKTKDRIEFFDLLFR